MEYDAEVAVVGGGVMGLATARALAQAGRDVVLLEQFAVGHDRGSSHGGSRIFRLTYPEAEWVRLAQEAMPLWGELESEWGAALREWHGSLDLGDWAADRDALQACGAPFEILGAKEVERRFPVRLEAGEQALFQADAGIVLADQALQALRGGAEAAGARVLERIHVQAIEESADGVRVSELRVRAVVVTAGAWADRLVELDTTPTRETVAYFAFSEPFPSMIDRGEGDTFGRLGYALVAPGIGAKAGRHHSGPVADPDEAGTPDAGIVAGIEEWATGRLRGLHPEPTRVETCLYTNRPAERFVLERRGRVVVGSPCSGHGFKFAPLIGGRLAALATEAL